MNVVHWALWCFFGILVIVHARPKNEQGDHLNTRECGYQKCHATERTKINIHLIAHTHDDVGWLKTVDQYYYGSETMTQKAGVQYILDSVVHELLLDPERKFTYVESAFFFKWFNEQTEELQKQVKQLVNEGRLEFAGGAWSMNDEATTHYQSLIDQFAWGLRLLNDTFGECGRPRVGWQIDPFGHSREMASIFAQMGFDGMFFARLDYEDKGERLRSKTPEMVWHASANLGESADLFTGILYNHYGPPPGFCFDILCSDDPIIDGVSSDYNVVERVSGFLAYVDKMSQYYRTNNLMIPMGDDFTYQDANMWYKNLDKLIKYTTAMNGTKYNIFYSSPSCYLKSLHDAFITWPSKSEDFFPYSSDPHAFWTGYFTSRPTLKRFERIGNHYLQVCKQLTTWATYQNMTDSHKLDDRVTLLREVMGIMQHHDAITGTEKEHVAFDYAKQLDDAIKLCDKNTHDVLNYLLKKDNSSLEVNLEFESCLNLNISVCDLPEKTDRFMVTLYNPLSHDTTEFIRVPVPGKNYEVHDHEGKLVKSQIVPIPLPVRHLTHRFSASTNELVFEAINISSHGYNSYYVSRILGVKSSVVPEVSLVRRGRDADTKGTTTLSNEHLQVHFGANGLLSSIDIEGQNYKVSQDFLYYEGAVGNNLIFANRSSGAYIFRPNSTEKRAAIEAQIEVVHGTLVEEVHQTFNDWISQVVRIYKKEKLVEFEWLIGPIPVEDNIGKEIITRITSDIQSDGVFYTDSNGREMLKRVRNKRETFEPNLQEYVAGNYYPITTKIALEDNRTRMALLNDRAQGGSSILNGALDLMLHRRLLHDDAFGVGEALNEKAYGQGLISRGKYYLILGSPGSKTKAYERTVQLEKLLPSWSFFSNLTQFTLADWTAKFKNQFSSGMSLPKPVNLMTMEPWKDNQTLLRFEHIMENGEDSLVSRVFDLKKFLQSLSSYEEFDIRETTLDGNQWLDESKRFKFSTEGRDASDTDSFINMTSSLRTFWNPQTSANEFDPMILMGPMQIKTFIVKKRT